MSLRREPARPLHLSLAEVSRSSALFALRDYIVYSDVTMYRIRLAYFDRTVLCGPVFIAMESGAFVRSGALPIRRHRLAIACIFTHLICVRLTLNSKSSFIAASHDKL